ncbi:hypothetical protein [Luteitalea sp.]|uniref:hypothetical protein n=1 Tax=Luteitalea sp. TaxID=2004800 RepID=UPI0025BC3981|nr:hypothetical protein [Luteitalea sp.]
MLRASILSIVLTLAIGPNADIVCQALCAPQADLTKPCDHDGTSPLQIAAGDDCCEGLLAGGASAQFTALRRDSSLPSGDVAIPVLGGALVRSATTHRLGYEPGRRQSLAHRPLPTILRI